jgi:hypothetical protein
VQLRRCQSGSDWTDDLGELFTLSEDGDGLDNRDASLTERMATVQSLFVFHHLRR